MDTQIFITIMAVNLLRGPWTCFSHLPSTTTYGFLDIIICVPESLPQGSRGDSGSWRVCGSRGGHG